MAGAGSRLHFYLQKQKEAQTELGIMRFFIFADERVKPYS